MRRNRPRACLCVLPGIDPEKQERLLIGYVGDQGYMLTSVTADHHAAIALGLAGLVDVVVVAVETAVSDEIAEQIEGFDAELAIVRPSPHRRARESRAAATIMRAYERGLDASDIAAVLDLPVEQVTAVLRDRPAPSPPTDRRRRPTSVATGGARW